MEETTIRPGYTMPTETDGTPADTARSRLL